MPQTVATSIRPTRSGGRPPPEVGSSVVRHASSIVVPFPVGGRDHMAPARPLSLLFVCRSHAVLSPMAEGLARAAFRQLDVTVQSAGLQPQPLDARAADCLAELGIDIGDIAPTSVHDLELANLDVVVCLGVHKLGLRRGQIAVAWDLPEPRLVNDGAAASALRDLRGRLAARVRSLGAVLATTPRA